MKGIIVVDIPETCGKCIAFKEWSGVCLASDHEEDMMDEVKKPDWCPIKPVPSKYRGLTNFECGFNHCIDEILGGEENE